MNRSGVHTHDQFIIWNDEFQNNEFCDPSGNVRPELADREVLSAPTRSSGHNSSNAVQPVGEPPMDRTYLTSIELSGCNVSGPLAVATEVLESNEIEMQEDDQNVNDPPRRCLPCRNFFAELLSILSFYRTCFGSILCFCMPLLMFLAWPFSDIRARCLYGVSVMVCFWLSNSMDAYAVALLPFVLFPALKVASVGLVATSYMNPVSFLILGASMMAAALRRVKLDIATANWLTRISPKHPADLSLFLMTACFTLSTCLSNTGTMLIFCPIIHLMIPNLQLDNGELSSEAEAARLNDLEVNIPVIDPGSENAGLQHQDQLNSVQLHDSDQGQLMTHKSKESMPSAGVSLDTEARTDRLAESEPLNGREAEILNETPALRRIRNMLFIGCAYASTLGGSATVTGSTTNVIFLSVIDAMYSALPGGSASNPVSYATWIVACLPLAVIQLFFVWLSLIGTWLGPKAAFKALVRLACTSMKPLVACCKFCHNKSKARTADGTTLNRTDGRNPSTPGALEDNRVQRTEKHELYWARVYVILAWILLLSLWLSRRSIVEAVPGWGDSLEKHIDDSWPAILVPLFLWFVPLYPRRSKPAVVRAISWSARCLRRMKRRVTATSDSTVITPVEPCAAPPARRRGTRKFEGILTFSVVEKEMDWGLIFLLGSGFVIASVSHACELDQVIVSSMGFLKSLSRAGQAACIMAIAALITQVTSNTATASVLMPLLATVANGLPGNPLLLMFAANFGTTLGFLLPISTPPNAVIVRFTRIGVWQFCLSGLLPLAVCMGIAYLGTFTWVAAVFHLLKPHPSGGQ